MDYEKETRSAFRNSSKAKTYKEQYTRGMKWARFTMWRERMCVKKALKQCNLKRDDKVLDIPCGTGLLFSVFSKFPFYIVASDISSEMMSLTREDRKEINLSGLVQADITSTPFANETFTCVITNGLMHRVPIDIKRRALKEIASLSNRFIIASYCIDSRLQRVKKRLIKMVLPAHIPAPAPAPLQDIINEFNSNELYVRKMYRIVNFLSAEVLFLLEKRQTQ